MSTPILPFAVWQSGTNENSIPANDNSLRNEILNGLVISDATTAQPVTPDDGDIYIIPSAATGSQWADFDQYDLTIYKSGTWYAYAPVSGIVVNISGSLHRWDGSSYVEISGGGTGFATVVTESGSNLDATSANSGDYTRFTNSFAKTYTFDASESYVVGAEYHGRNVGSGDLTILPASSMTINPPAGGTLVIPQHGTFTVKIVDTDEADLFGVTVEA